MSDVVHGQQPPRSSSTAAAVLVLVLGVATVIATAGAGAYFLSEWAGQRHGGDSPGSAAAAPGAGASSQRLPPLISVAGFDQLLDALEEQTGSTTVVDLTLYPRYAVAVVPLRGGKGRTQSLYFDGTFREQNLGTSDDRPLDLRDIDPELLVTLSRKARKAVEDPTQWYLILRAPDIEGAVIYAYASNAYGEGGYVAARRDGTIVNRVGW